MDDYGVNLTILKKVTIAENRQEWEFVWNSSCVPNAELTIFFDERHSTCWDIQKKGNWQTPILFEVVATVDGSEIRLTSWGW